MQTPADLLVSANILRQGFQPCAQSTRPHPSQRRQRVYRQPSAPLPRRAAGPRTRRAGWAGEGACLQPPSWLLRGAGLLPSDAPGPPPAERWSGPAKGMRWWERSFWCAAAGGRAAHSTSVVLSVCRARNFCLHILRPPQAGSRLAHISTIFTGALLASLAKRGTVPAVARQPQAKLALEFSRSLKMHRRADAVTGPGSAFRGYKPAETTPHLKTFRLGFKIGCVQFGD